MGDLTKNLSRHEFACKCGCGFDTVDVETLALIQLVCDHFTTSVTITSGCRCDTHNANVGGVVNSRHKQGRAADCKFDGVRPAEVHEFLSRSLPESGGFGLYPTFNHIDSRSGIKARWRQTSKS